MLRQLWGMCPKGIFYLIFTPFVAKVTVHGPPPVETSSFAVKDVGVSSTMLKRHFLDSPHSVPSSGHTQVFPLTVPPLVNVPPRTRTRDSVLAVGLCVGIVGHDPEF